MDEHSSQNGGFITDYTFMSQSVNEILKLDSKKFTIGLGYKNMNMYAISLSGIA